MPKAVANSHKMSAAVKCVGGGGCAPSATSSETRGISVEYGSQFARSPAGACGRAAPGYGERMAHRKRRRKLRKRPVTRWQRFVHWARGGDNASYYADARGDSGGGWDGGGHGGGDGGGGGHG